VQTPEVPSPSDPSPDGVCAGTCDCGSAPCGEYLFDFRNGSSLTDYLLNVYLGGPMGLGSPVVDVRAECRCALSLAPRFHCVRAVLALRYVAAIAS
jgi:hypothetical protein